MRHHPEAAEAGGYGNPRERGNNGEDSVAWWEVGGSERSERQWHLVAVRLQGSCLSLANRRWLRFGAFVHQVGAEWLKTR